MRAASRRRRVVVVGSGAGGLVAALTAARRGHDVVVLEAEKAIGVLLNPFQRGPHRFDTGLHYVGACGPDGLFQRLVERLELDLTMAEIDPDGFERVVLPGYEVRVPRGAEVYRDRLASDFPAERAGLERVFGVIDAFGRSLPRSLDELGADSATALRSAQPGAALSSETFASFLGRHLEDPLLVGVLAAQSGNYALPPSRAAAFTGVSILEHYLRDGAFYPRGGSGALRDALVAALEARGVELATQRRVERILVQGGRARGVRCVDDREISADAVVSDVDAATTMLDLVDRAALDARAVDRFERLAPSLGSVCLFVGARGQAARLREAGLGAANEWWFDDVDPELGYAGALEGRIDLRSAFFSSPSLKDPAHASDDATLTVLASAPFAPFAPWADGKTRRRGPAYELVKAGVRDSLLARVEARVPGLLASADAIDVSTPATTRTFVGARFGGSYGPAHTPGQAGLLRGRVASPVPGLYLAGASVFGAGVVWSALSGWAAGSAV